MLGYGMFGMTYLGFAFANSLIHAIILFVAYDIFFAFADTLQRAIVHDLIEAKSKGTAFGVLHTTTGITAFISNSLAGLPWQIHVAFVPFILGAIISIISTILFLFLKPGKY